MIKIATEGLKDGFEKYEGYWDKHNNGSLILHLKMGFKIEDMRKNEQLYLVGNLKEVRDRSLRLYRKLKIKLNESSNSSTQLPAMVRIFS